MNAQDTVTTPKKRNNWILPASVGIGYTAGTYLCYRFGDTKIHTASQQHKTKFETAVADAVTNLGLGKYQTIGLGATAIFSFISRNKKLEETSIIWAGSLLINSVTTDQLKKTFQRHRPNTGDPY